MKRYLGTTLVESLTGKEMVSGYSYLGRCRLSDLSNTNRRGSFEQRGRYRGVVAARHWVEIWVDYVTALLKRPPKTVVRPALPLNAVH